MLHRLTEIAAASEISTQAISLTTLPRRDAATGSGGLRLRPRCRPSSQALPISPEVVDRARRQVEQSRLIPGQLVSDDGSAAAIVVVLQAPFEDHSLLDRPLAELQTRLRALLRTEAASLVAGDGDPAGTPDAGRRRGAGRRPPAIYRLHFGGLPFVRVETVRHLKSEQRSLLAADRAPLPDRPVAHLPRRRPGGGAAGGGRPGQPLGPGAAAGDRPPGQRGQQHRAQPDPGDRRLQRRPHAPRLPGGPPARPRRAGGDPPDDGGARPAGLPHQPDHRDRLRLAAGRPQRDPARPRLAGGGGHHDVSWVALVTLFPLVLCPLRRQDPGRALRPGRADRAAVARPHGRRRRPPAAAGGGAVAPRLRPGAGDRQPGAGRRHDARHLPPGARRSTRATAWWSRTWAASCRSRSSSRARSRASSPEPEDLRQVFEMQRALAPSCRGCSTSRRWSTSSPRSTTSATTRRCRRS